MQEPPSTADTVIHKSKVQHKLSCRRNLYSVQYFADQPAKCAVGGVYILPLRGKDYLGFLWLLGNWGLINNFMG